MKKKNIVLSNSIGKWRNGKKMGWASNYIKDLKESKIVKFRPHGNSMVPKVNSGDLVTVMPLTDKPEPGDIVLCKVGGREFLHLISAVRQEQFQISNNKGHINGWVTIQNIFGKCTSVEK